MALALPMTLAGQTTDSADSAQVIGEVVVRGARVMAPSTVVKIPAPRREIPLTTNILPLEKIRLLGYTDPAQAMQTVPGVGAFKDYGGFHMFFLRGFYESVVLNDGMRDERHALWQSAPLTGMAAVDHIEVLKGAASMSVGHSALGAPSLRRKLYHRLLRHASYHSWWDKCDLKQGQCTCRRGVFDQ